MRKSLARRLDTYVYLRLKREEILPKKPTWELRLRSIFVESWVVDTVGPLKTGCRRTWPAWNVARLAAPLGNLFCPPVVPTLPGEGKKGCLLPGAVLWMEKKVNSYLVCAKSTACTIFGLNGWYLFKGSLPISDLMSYLLIIQFIPYLLPI